MTFSNPPTAPSHPRSLRPRGGRQALLLSLALAATLHCSGASAGGFTLQGGQVDGISRYSLGYTADPVFTYGSLSIVPVYEIARFRSNRAGLTGNDTLWQISAVPMFRYHFDRLYLEAGIGASLFNGTGIEDRQLSTAFQFSDHIGIGYRFSPNLTVGYRFSHFSNGGIRRPNAGINSQSLMLNVAF